MAFDDKVFKDEFVPNIQSANKTNYNQWKQSNPGEAAKWEKFRDAAIAYQAGDPPVPVPALATKYGRALVAAGKLHVSVTDIGADYTVIDTPPPPPPPTTAYFVEDWSSGTFQSSKWDLLYSYTPPGYFSTPRTATPDGRVSIVNDPAGTPGVKCARLEIRDGDPTYPQTTSAIDKSEIDMGNSTRTWNGNFTFGTVRWFEWDIYLPYTATEKFQWPHGGTQPFFALLGLHPPGNSPAFWSAVHLEWNAYQFNAGGDSANYANIGLNFHIEGGTWNGGGANPNDHNYKMLPLTDSTGARVMANHNRWIHFVWGAKFNPDNTGWFEAWIDGVNVVPRVNRPTSWDVDGPYPDSYFKYGLYTKTDATFPELPHSTVAYFGRTTIGTDRPF